MYKKKLLSALVATAMIGGASFSAVYAEEAEQEQEQVTDVEKEAVDAAVTDGKKFDDPERLEDTLIGWQEELVDAAGDDVVAAEKARDDAIDDGAPQDEIDALQENVDAAEKTLAEAEDNLVKEKEILPEQIAELTEEQLFALNRSLNNATNNGLIVDLNSDYMQDLLDGNYNKQQINSLTKALEEEAKFDKLSDKFAAKYDLTGNDKFSDKADMMSLKGDRQKDKFLGKVDKFGSDDGDEVEHHNKAMKSMRGSAKNSVKDTAKSTTKDVAKTNAKGAAKANAKAAAKSNAKDAAKSNAKAVAKSRAKDNARNKAKSNNGKKA